MLKNHSTMKIHGGMFELLPKIKENISSICLFFVIMPNINKTRHPFAPIGDTMPPPPSSLTFGLLLKHNTTSCWLQTKPFREPQCKIPIDAEISF